MNTKIGALVALIPAGDIKSSTDVRQCPPQVSVSVDQAVSYVAVS